MIRHVRMLAIAGLATAGLESAAQAVTQKVTISQSSAVVDSVALGLSSLQGDAVVSRIFTALQEAGYVAHVDVIKLSPSALTTDINSVQTSVLDFNAFVTFPANSRVPALMIGLKQTRVLCPVAMPTGTTCTNSTTLLVTGPLASYGQVSSPASLDTLLRGKQTFTWTLTQAATGTGQTLQGNFSATSLQFERSLLQAIGMVDKSILERQTEPLTQNRALVAVSAVLTTIGERVMQ